MADQTRERWHVAPDGADWTDHVAGLDCDAHMDFASRGEVPFGGTVELRGGDAPGQPHPDEAPEWRRRRLASAPVYGDWWRRRHHCSDVVLGSTHTGDERQGTDGG